MQCPVGKWLFFYWSRRQTCAPSLWLWISSNEEKPNWRERHYSPKHATLNEFGGHMRLDKIIVLQQSLELQQAAFTRPPCDRDNIIQISYAVSELNAKKKIEALWVN